MAIGRTVAALSKKFRVGTGSVIGGRAALIVDPHLLAHLTRARDVVIVSATNGKTTTTRLLAAAIGADQPVISNWLGANMTPGLVAALGPSSAFATAVLEVDERWLPRVLLEIKVSHGDASPLRRGVVLLNLSRDQLDRTQEVRHLAEAWRKAFKENQPTFVVANADDPLVTYAALTANNVVWVSTGMQWTADASGCPACAGRISFSETNWSCSNCDLQRPTPSISLTDDGIYADQNYSISLPLPGRVNRMNATFAFAAARQFSIDATRVIHAMEQVEEVAGRYRTATFAGQTVRLLLAKNPAGWHEALNLLERPDTPAIIGINSRIADGHDPSWLWDVDFEQLKGRYVIATGERRHDLAVRLHYAEVEHEVVEHFTDCVRIAGQHLESNDITIDIVSNYTAFQDQLAQLGGLV